MGDSCKATIERTAVWRDRSCSRRRRVSKDVDKIFLVRYAFHPEAETEFVRAVEYYEEREEGLGLDFAVEIYSTIERSLAHPQAWPVIEEDIRRSLVGRFPYGLLYAEEGDRILIVAVMHLHREPDYWKHRM